MSPGIPPLGDNVFNCSCSNCKTVLKETAHWTELKKDSINPTNVSVGDRVIVHGKYLGVVRYIGDLDSSFTNDKFYVGVKLDDPGMSCTNDKKIIIKIKTVFNTVGKHDGIHKGKRFFKCPPQHGVLVPLQQVAVVSLQIYIHIHHPLIKPSFRSQFRGRTTESDSVRRSSQLL